MKDKNRREKKIETGKKERKNSRKEICQQGLLKLPPLTRCVFFLNVIFTGRSWANS